MTTYNTGNPIGSTDARDLYDNAENLDYAVNSNLPAFTDRLGVSRRTFRGIEDSAAVVLAGLGYAVPVPYTAGISLTLPTQTVEYAGEVYAPFFESLPFTTSGVFESASFRVIQGVTAADLASGVGASMVGYTPAGAGAVATDVQSKLRESADTPQDFMTPEQKMDVYLRSGSVDVTGALTAAFARAGATGNTLNVPAGVYNISSTVAWNITNGFAVVCAPGVVFKASASMPVDAKLFNPAASSGSQRFVWRGGTLDGRAMPPRSVGAPDLLYINSRFIKNVDVEGAAFICNDDRSGTAGDSCLFLAEGEDYRIVGNHFQGAFDAGVYISGDSTNTLGRRVIVTGNTFVECLQVGVISKREFENHIISGNFALNCTVGVVLGGETGTSSSAFKGVITGNVITNCTTGISVRLCDGTVVSGNRIEDSGYDASGVAVGTPGIAIEGSDNCIVSGNHLTVISPTDPHVNNTGIQIKPRTVLGVTHQSEYTLVTGNTIKGCPRGIIEDATSNFTLIGENLIIDNTGAAISISGSGSQFGATLHGSVPYKVGLAGATSLQVRPVAGSVNFIDIAGSSGATVALGTDGSGADVNLAINPKGAGVVVVGGGAGAESLRVSKGVASGNAVQVNGTAAGSPPSIVARGNDVNIDLSLLPKGTGLLRFGTRTASADAPITGYIEVKDISGTTRRLAVIG